MRWNPGIILFLISLTFFGCKSGGGGGGEETPPTTGLNAATSVKGTVLSASGDPVPGTLVYIPGATVSAARMGASRTHVLGATAGDGTPCEDPPGNDSPLAFGCTGADGSFEIDTSAITTNPDQIVFQRGSLRMVQTLSCPGGDPCELDNTTTTFGNDATWPKIAVVSGDFDRMEDVLAKLADGDTSDEVNGDYGRVNKDSGVFVYGSEFGTNMTVIDGNNFTNPEENAAEIGTYDTWDTYLDGTNPLVDGGTPVFDVIFINCGNDFESLIQADPTSLQDYVDAGGRIYVTDLSYDFVEQAFPQVMKFQGDPNDPTTPGPMNFAQAGTSGVTIDAVVTDSSFANFLKSVRVNRKDASTPGNPDDDCKFFDPEYDQVTSALKSGDLIPIGDFLGGWGHMMEPHAGENPTIWIAAGPGVNFDGQENRPLTVSQDIGSNGGRVVYSSYHTAHSCPSITFWPQERVLQYLMFQAF